MNVIKHTDKLRVLLPHWIEHNREHGLEFKKWVTALETDGEPDLALLINQAAALFDKATELLDQALSLAGGPEGEHHHHHHGV